MVFTMFVHFLGSIGADFGNKNGWNMYHGEQALRVHELQSSRASFLGGSSFLALCSGPAFDGSF